MGVLISSILSTRLRPERVTYIDHILESDEMSFDVS